jgi:hypothetical protein
MVTLIYVDERWRKNIAFHNSFNSCLLMDCLTAMPVHQQAYKILLGKIEGKRPLATSTNTNTNCLWDKFARK